MPEKREEQGYGAARMIPPVAFGKAAILGWQRSKQVMEKRPDCSCDLDLLKKAAEVWCSDASSFSEGNPSCSKRKKTTRG